jgi:hypothetical protein
MNWPAPEVLQPPTTPSEPDEGPAERLARSGRPAATWVALLGGSLILVAATSIVVSSWDTVGRSLRAAGLVLAAAVMLVAAERLRRLAPVTANIVAHVGTFLVAAVGIAAMSLGGFTWPACLLVGGVVALAAVTLQRDRWTPEVFRASQVIAVSMAATGLAATAGIPGAMIAVGVSIVFLAIGADRRAAALAITAVAAPALTALANAGVGSGTLERAGLIGDRLIWVGPVVGLIAGGVLAIAGFHRDNIGLLLAAAAAPVVGTMSGLIDRLDLTAVDVKMSLFTAAALGVGVVARQRSKVNSWIAYAPGLTVGALWLFTVQLERDTVWAIPVGLTFGLAAAAIGAWRRLAAPLVGGTAITLVTTLVATGTDLDAVPTWAWLAAGGALLIALAISIERTSKRDTSLKDLVERWD